MRTFYNNNKAFTSGKLPRVLESLRRLKILTVEDFHRRSQAESVASCGNPRPLGNFSGDITGLIT